MSAPPPPPPPLLVRSADGAVRWAAPTHDAASAPAGTHAPAAAGAGGAYALPRWEAEVDAVYLLARQRCGRWGVDASRRVLEAAPRALALRYYERWCFAVAALLIETGVLSNAEVEDGLDALRPPGQRRADQAAAAAGGAPRFCDGARVRVLRDNPPAHWRTPHLRVPAYAQGRTGVVERCCGAFDAPEERAWHGAPVPQRLYRVTFAHAHLFDGAAVDEGADTATVEISERWLEAADASHAEQAACGTSVYEPLLAVIKALLIAKGVLSQADIDAHVAAQAELAASGPARGGRVVAAAWCDAAFRARLLADGGAACAELGVSTAGIAQLVVVENTAAVHNLIVCSLCSCYPRPLLGAPPEWYRSWAYRARAVRCPRVVLAEWGVQLPPGTAVAVHDSSADCRYMVLPRRPDGTEGWDEARLAALVSTESLVGVSVIPPQAADAA
jgi:nitrile hydratase